MGVIVDGVCLVCKRPTDEHERDVMWGEWDCPKEKKMDSKKRMEIVDELLGPPGKMLSQSKSAYSGKHPKSIVYFNGNVYDQDGNKLWYGDVDTTRQAKDLQAIALRIGERIYVTSESPFRWENQTTKTLEEAAAETAYSRCLRIDP